MLSRIVFPRIESKPSLTAFFSGVFLAFGLYNIHAVSGITEGGILGLTLLLQHWAGISPSITSFVLSLACYALGFRLLGVRFIVYSVISVSGFAASYELFELWGPIWPQLADMPFLAAVLGALCVGLGAGVCVRAGGAPGGDDALAMSLSDLLKIRIQWAYLGCDLIVLALSLTYIPFEKIAYSLLTVVLSGQIVGLVQNARLPSGAGRKSLRRSGAAVEEE